MIKYEIEEIKRVITGKDGLSRILTALAASIEKASDWRRPVLLYL
jgi:hypothetical protein